MAFIHEGLSANHVDWSTSIRGVRPLDREGVVLPHLTAAAALEFLCECTYSKKGVLIIDQDTHGRALLSGIGSESHGVNLWDIFHQARINPSHEAENFDLVFVPCAKRSFPKTTHPFEIRSWAIRNNLPYYQNHGNDWSLFSGFSPRIEHDLFGLFLCGSLFRADIAGLQFSSADWEAIRLGLFEHGWTINASLCSYSKGNPTFRVWRGVPTELLWPPGHPPNTRFYQHSDMLEITRDETGCARVVRRTMHCPMESSRGTVRFRHRAPAGPQYRPRRPYAFRWRRHSYDMRREAREQQKVITKLARISRGPTN